MFMSSLQLLLVIVDLGYDLSAENLQLLRAALQQTVLYPALPTLVLAKIRCCEQKTTLYNVDLLKLMNKSQTKVV